MDRLLPRDRSRIKQIYIYPSVVCSNYVVYGFNADETVLLCCIGTLCEFLRENFAQSRNSGIQLTQTLSALSNRNRFNILTKLLDGPPMAGNWPASWVCPPSQSPNTSASSWAPSW